MKATWANTVIAESNDTVVVDGNHYFPPQSIKDNTFSQAQRTRLVLGRESPYYTLKVGSESNPDAAWFYPDPKEAARAIRNYVAFWRGVKITE